MTEISYLFDTDAISETLRKKPLTTYINWLKTIPLKNQYTSSVVIAELYKGAYRSENKIKIIENIETKILPVLTILPFNKITAKIYGEISAQLEKKGQKLAHPDLQIAATAIQYDLELVTANIKHFNRISQLKINLILSQAKLEQI